MSTTKELVENISVVTETDRFTIRSEILHRVEAAADLRMIPTEHSIWDNQNQDTKTIWKYLPIFYVEELRDALTEHIAEVKAVLDE